jgi:hypothetical protein
MTRMIALVLALSTAPLAALATPMRGDVVGTNPTDATAALKDKGCTVTAFEAEDGKIEAKCTDDASGKAMEVYIDPASGAVTEIKTDD